MVAASAYLTTLSLLTCARMSLSYACHVSVPVLSRASTRFCCRSICLTSASRLTWQPIPKLSWELAQDS